MEKGQKSVDLTWNDPSILQFALFDQFYSFRNGTLGCHVNGSLRDFVGDNFGRYTICFGGIMDLESPWFAL